MDEKLTWKSHPVEGIVRWGVLVAFLVDVSWY